MKYLHSRTLVIVAALILVISSGLAYVVFMHEQTRESAQTMEIQAQQDSVEDNKVPEEVVNTTESDVDVKAKELRSQDGELYRDVNLAFEAIEAKYAVKSLSRNKVSDLFVTNPVTKENLINKDYSEKDEECCRSISLYRWNLVTLKYDMVVPDLRTIKGYSDYVDEFTAKSFQYIFSWSDDGRYIYFAHAPYESFQTGGQMYLDTQNLDFGFQKFDVYFDTWLVSPDRTKALGQECEIADDTWAMTCGYFLFDFNIAKVTPIFKDKENNAEILNFSTLGMNTETWPYLHWIDNSRIEFYTIDPVAHRAIENCTLNAEYKGAETFDHCTHIIKENFSTLKRHVVDVSGAM